jgi:competence protein ComFC
MPLQLPQTEAHGWRKWSGWALDLLYPPSCALCRCVLSHGRALCETCDSELPRLKAPFCSSCGEPFEGQIEGAFACPNCRQRKFSFAFARPSLVCGGQASELIHRFKYGREIHLAGDLGRLASEAFLDPRLAPALAAGWPLVPVPLHRKRQQFRHFNQAEEIARHLARRTGLPLLKALVRSRSTETQTRLSRAQRLENLRGAFAITARARRWLAHSPTGAVLVDDVFTTGSTVDECAKILRRAGFQTIYVVTVMRG